MDSIGENKAVLSPHTRVTLSDSLRIPLWSIPWLIACWVTYQNILLEKFEGVMRIYALQFYPYPIAKITKKKDII